MRLSSVWKTEENMELLTLIVYIFSHAECHGSRKRGLLTLPIHKILSWNNAQTVIRLKGLKLLHAAMQNNPHLEQFIRMQGK